MRSSLYPRLAIDGIRKNRRLYLPYILTCTGMVMMHYIINFIATSESLRYIPHAETARSLIGIGGWVIAIFAAIFLFYTNSFLIRRRKKEFGLYNILGMGKKNLAVILLWENLFTALISISCGIGAGIILSKLAELGFINIVEGDISYALSISYKAILISCAVFAAVFVLLYLNALRQISFSSAASLIKSESTGEKPPKGNLIIGVLGVLMLAAAYTVAVLMKNPVSAVYVFTGDVILVIIATFICMISGSVVLCRLLQRKKKYYYNPKHFVSVSSMAYRMKRNGAGLASICILSTMVLVMISSTATLYFGSEDAINRRYPHDFNIKVELPIEEATVKNISSLRQDISTVASEYNAEILSCEEYRCATISGLITGSSVETDITKAYDISYSFSDVHTFYFIPLADYNAAMNCSETLEKNEALLYSVRSDFSGGELSFNNGSTLKIKKRIDKCVGIGDSMASIVPTIVLIVPDLNTATTGLEKLADYNGDRMLRFNWNYGFDTDLPAEEQLAMNDELENFDFSILKEKMTFVSLFIESREDNRSDFMGTFGGLFYLGILLSIVFIFAAVLIIYYKQISEGYEDQARFEVMQKIGMTKTEIRRSINSQLLTVFFLPLLGAGMHLSFAFPIIKRLLLLFNLDNAPLFAAATLICFALFALFYTVVYRITSKAYYKIVSGAMAE